MRLSGLPVRRQRWTCSPAKRSATGKKPRRSLTSAHPPQAARCALSGLPARRLLLTCNPAKRSASREEIMPIPHLSTSSAGGAMRLVRVTGPQTAVNP